MPFAGRVLRCSRDSLIRMPTHTASDAKRERQQQIASTASGTRCWSADGMRESAKNCLRESPALGRAAPARRGAAARPMPRDDAPLASEVCKSATGARVDVQASSTAELRPAVRPSTSPARRRPRRRLDGEGPRNCCELTSSIWTPYQRHPLRPRRTAPPVLRR